MFKTIASSDFDALLQLGKKFYVDFHDIPASLLCFDHVFIRPFRLQNMECPELSELLEGFLMYTEELRKLSFQYEAFSDAAIQRLFGFQTSENQIVTVPNSSYMYTFLFNSGALRSREDGFITMLSNDFMPSFSQALRNRIEVRVHAEHIELSGSPIFRPCLVHAVYGECNTADCHTRYAHIAKEKMNVEWYNARVRVVLQQIQICQTLRSIQRRWNQDLQRK